MRVWKLEACADEGQTGCRWGHALAETEAEALAIARQTSGLPFNRVHAKHPAMLWPGAPGARVDWS